MKNTYMRQVYMGVIGDMKTLENHFARMAEMGWMIDKIGMFTHRYRAVEPCKKQFFVDLLPQITAFDYPENEVAQDYRRLCEESGWTFLTASKQFHVFCAECDTSAPVPIHTDNKIQAKIYLKACRKYELFPYIFQVFTLGLLIAAQLLSGIEVFLSNLVIFQMLGYLLFSVGNFWIIGFVFLWYRRTKKAAELDLPMPQVNYRLARVRGKVFTLGIFSFIICMLTGIVLEISGGMPAELLLIGILPIAAVGAGLWIRRQIDTKRRERKANIRLFVVSLVIMELILLGVMGFVVWNILSVDRIEETLDNRLALTLQDIGVASAPVGTDTLINGSVAVPVHYSYWEWNGEGNVNTEVYRSVSKSLTRGLYNRYVKEQSYNDETGYDGGTELSSEEAAFWGAEEGVMAFSPDKRSIKLILLREKSLLRLWLDSNSINESTAAQAVQRLWID